MAQTRRRPNAPKKGTRPIGGRRNGAGRWGQGFLQCTVCQHPERGRIDYFACSGASLRSLETQFGVGHSALQRHYQRHVTERFKKLCAAQHLTSFEEMLQNATEANAETVDIINLLIRGHAQRWAICPEAGADKAMNFHSSKILSAIELRSKITLELQPEARNLTINNFITRDAAELVKTLRDNPAAVAKIEEWYASRMDAKLIEHEAAD
jgi:IS30 family transposase